MTKQKKEGSIPSSDTKDYFNLTEFQSVLQTMLETHSQRDLAALTGVSSEHISRTLNGHRTNRPTLTTIKKLAKASNNKVLLLQLFRSAGYESEGLLYIKDLPDESFFQKSASFNSEPYFHILMKYFALLKEKKDINWQLQSGNPYTNHLLISLESSVQEWHFILADYQNDTEESILNLYGFISSYKCEVPSKFTLITCSIDFYNHFLEMIPYNLSVYVSVMLIDPEVKTILTETYLSIPPDGTADQLVSLHQI